MRKNMGTADRVIRLLIAITILILNNRGVITGALATVAIVFAVVFLLTSSFGYCPLYRLFRISSVKK